MSPEADPAALRSGPRIGIVAWFQFGDEAGVRRSLEMLDELGIRLLRTGFSWADYERLDADGPAWFDYLMHDVLAERVRGGQLDVLFNFLYTPWSQTRVKSDGRRTTASPPARLGGVARRDREVAEPADLRSVLSLPTDRSSGSG